MLIISTENLQIRRNTHYCCETICNTCIRTVYHNNKNGTTKKTTPEQQFRKAYDRKKKNSICDQQKKKKINWLKSFPLDTPHRVYFLFWKHFYVYKWNKNGKPHRNTKWWTKWTLSTHSHTLLLYYFIFCQFNNILTMIFAELSQKNHRTFFSLAHFSSFFFLYK